MHFSIWELMLILVIVLVLFGGSRLRNLGSDLGSAIRGFRDAMKEGGKPETADLWFHTLVMLAHQGLGPDAVLNELRRRFGVSGLTEKAARVTG